MNLNLRPARGGGFSWPAARHHRVDRDSLLPGVGRSPRQGELVQRRGGEGAPGDPGPPGRGGEQEDTTSPV